MIKNKESYFITHHNQQTINEKKFKKTAVNPPTHSHKNPVSSLPSVSIYQHIINMTPKIAFIQKGKIPLSSHYVAQTLQKIFPEYEVEIIDITQLLKSTFRGILVKNIFYTLKEYGFEIIQHKKYAKDCFFRTTYLFGQIKKMMTQQLADPAYIFSFQVQSLYDASYPGLPHFVYTDHTNLANLLYPIQDRNKVYSKAWLRLEQEIYEKAHHVFTRSTNISDSIVEQYGRDAQAITCVYAGNNMPSDSAVALENGGYTNKNILFVGIDWERKGGPELVDAFRQVLTVHPDAQLTIVGCNPKVDVPNCQVIGRIPLSDVKKYYLRASIFCLPTKLEPFGIAFIEAFSHKLPIVATPIGAIPDFIISGKNGYLVEPGASVELATALIQLLDDPIKCRQFGEQGYKLVQENYTWDKVGVRLRQTIMATLRPGA